MQNRANGRTKPRVEVIIPVFRGERYLGEAVDSVLAQTYDDWHLTIVDDASPDHSLVVARDYAARHPGRIAVVALSRNRGGNVARMEGARHSASALIAFLDHDDRWKPTFLATQVAALDRTGCACAHGAIAVMDAHGRPVRGGAARANRAHGRFAWATATPDEVLRHVGLDTQPWIPTVVVRRDAFLDIGGFTEARIGGEDWEFWLRFVRRYRLTYTPEPLVERRVHADNWTYSRVDERVDGWLQVTRQVAKDDPTLARLCRQRSLHVLRRAVRLEMQQGLVDHARRRSRQLLAAAPLDPRHYFMALWAARGASPLSGLLGRLYALARRAKAALAGTRGDPRLDVDGDALRD